MVGTEPRITDLQLEQLALGELSPDVEAALRARLAEDPDAQTRLAALERSNREIRAAYPPGPQVGAIRRKHEAGRRRDRRRRLLLTAVPVTALAATAAVLLLTLGPLAGDPSRPASRAPRPGGPAEDVIRVKGPSRILVFRHGEKRALQNGARVRTGDRLMVHYVAVGSVRYGVILSQDGRGEVTLHLPAAVGGTTALVQGAAQALPNSFVLDDAPGFERFFFVVSDQPIDVAAVQRAVQAIGRDGTRRPALPAGSVLRTELVFVRPSRR